jgi:hypothetical protein
MRKVIWLFLAVTLSSSALALEPDAGMLTQVSGSVDIANVLAKRPAVAFGKVAEGDKLLLDKDGFVRLVYFRNGRQETWRGAGQVTISDNEGKSDTVKAEVKQLPAMVFEQLTRVPAAGAQGKVGMVRLRSIPSKDKIAQIESRFADLKKSLPADDATPEIYLVAGLIDAQAYDRARSVLQELKTRETSEPHLAAVVAHFTPLLQTTGAETTESK